MIINEKIHFVDTSISVVIVTHHSPTSQDHLCTFSTVGNDLADIVRIMTSWLEQICMHAIIIIFIFMSKSHSHISAAVCMHAR